MLSVSVLSTVALLIVAGCVRAQRNPVEGIPHYFGPEQPLSNQCAEHCKAADHSCKPKLCPVTLGGFYYLCGEFDYLDAQEACGKRGWRLAVLNGENKEDAYNTMAQCLLLGGQGAWISNYDGADADPCAILLRSGGILMGLGQQACSKRKLGALCERIPEITFTKTSYTTATVSSGTATETVTVHKHHSSSSSSSCSSSSSDDHHHHHHGHHHHHHGHHHCSWTCDKAADPNCVPCTADDLEKADAHHCPSCAPVCPVRIGNIRIIQKNVTTGNAAEECAKYGWSLLDLTVGTMSALSKMAKACSYGDYNLWINSYNGVASPCLNSFTFQYSDGAPVGFPAIDGWCQGELYVACQKNPPAQTGSGPYFGLFDKEIKCTTVTEEVIVPSTTVTVTTTVCGHHSHSHSHGHHCPHCHHH